MGEITRIDPRAWERRNRRPPIADDALRAAILAIEAEELAAGRPGPSSDGLRSRIKGASGERICRMRRRLVMTGELRAYDGRQSRSRIAPGAHGNPGPSPRPIPARRKRPALYPLQPIVRKHLAREMRIRAVSDEGRERGDDGPELR